jgi:hypothetical protein
MENFDITEFAKMFDAALASDNPSVQKALKNFMMVAAIVHAQELSANEKIIGPLELLIRKVTDLERIVYDLRNNNVYTRPAKEDYYKTYTNSPAWIYNSNISTSAISNGQSITAEHIKDLMKDIKFDE